jgi:hypothetical protein
MPFPTITTCIVCEQARPEIGGKFTLLGFYGVAPDVRINIQNFNQPVGLCFVFVGGAGSGHFVIGLRITAPNGQTFDAPSVEGDLAPAAIGSRFFMGFAGVLPGPGNYSASLLVNGTPNSHATFGLDNAPAAAVVPGAPAAQPN